MLRIVTLVEGHGEVAAVPNLLRRIAEAVTPGVALDLSRTIRVKRQRFLKEGELERAVELAARQSGDDDPRSVSVFDPSIRGSTDQFIYKFRRPR